MQVCNLGVESFYGPEDFEVMTNKLHQELKGIR